MHLLLAAAAAASMVGAASMADAPVAPPPIIYAPPAPPPGLPKGTPVSVPFAPPLGVPLDYSFSRSDESSGERKGAAFDLALRFERAGAEYRMTVTVGVRGLSPAQRADPGIRMLEQPITYRVAADGRILGMDREDEYWRDVLKLLRAYEKDSSGSAQSSGLMEKMIRYMRSLPDDERMALAAGNIAPILELAGADMKVGEKVELRGEEARLAVPTPAMAKIRRNVAVTLDRATSDSASFALVTTYDDAAMRAVMADLASLAPPDKRPDPGILPVQIVDRVVQTVSRTTGLSTFYMRRMEGKDGAGGTFRRTIMIRARNLPR